MNHTLNIPSSIRKSAALLAIVTLLATSLPIGVMVARAESTGVTINPTSVTTEVNTKVNFVVNATSNASTTPDTYISVTDNGAGGSIYEGTIEGECNNDVPDIDSRFSIDQNKGVCYSHSTPGVYPVSVQLYDSSDVAIGSPAVIQVTVNAPVAPQVVTATNFNTHSGTDYEGINVGFTLNDQFGTVSAVKVQLFKGGDLIAENNHNEALLTLINEGEESLSTPFIINSGTYTETYWNLGAHSWTSDDVPTKAVISVTDETGTYTAENNILNEPNGWLLANILPQPLSPFPSTNDQNRTNNHPHVNFVSDAPGEVTLSFVNNTNSVASFEYRIDGEVLTSGTPHDNPCKLSANPLDGACGGLRYLSDQEILYPTRICIDNRGSLTPVCSTLNPQEITLNANNYVEVRLARGGERDWDFDWVTFQVPEPKDEVITNTVVHPFALNGFVVEETGGGQTTFVKDLTDSPLGDGYLNLVSDSQDSARAGVSKPVDELLSEISGLSYSTKQNSANFAGGNAAYRISFDADGNTATTNDVATLVYEPYWQNNESPDTEPVVPGEWQDWDVDNGLFWASIPTANRPSFLPNLENGAGGPPFYTLDQVIAHYPNARVTSFGVGIGSSNPSYDINVDEIVFGTEDATTITKTIYDFEPAPTGTVTLCKVDQFDDELSGWQLALIGDTVATYEVPSNGTVVETDVIPAGDYVVKSTGTFTYRGPGLQSDTRYLERLPTDPGYETLPYKPWQAATIGGLHIDGSNAGWGDIYSPTHNYYAPLTLATADSVELMIGDDTYGDNVGSLNPVIHKGYTGVTDEEDGCVTFADVTYGTYQVEELLQTGWVNYSGLGELVVDDEEVEHEIVNIDTTVAPEAPEHETPENNSSQNENDFYFQWTDVDGAVEYEFQSSQNPSVDENGVLNIGVWNNKASGNSEQNYLTESEIHSVGANGTWYWQVRAIDTYGNMSEWTEPWKLTIDMVTPSVPQITSPVDEQIFATAPILNQWTVSTDNDAIDYYQIAYSYDDGHTFGGTTCPDVTIGGGWVGCRDTTNTSRNHSPSTSEQGGVTIWVRAFDNAGNASEWSDPVHYYYYTSGSLPVDEAPAIPTGLGWTDSNGNPVANGGTTDLVSGKALWDANGESDFNHYIYKYWNNIPTSAYNGETHAWIANNINTNSLSGVFNQGEGTHYFCIIAEDNAGNQSDCSDEFTITYETTPATPPSFTVGTTTVEATDLETGSRFAISTTSNKWFFYNDNDGGSDGIEDINNSLGSFVTGPETTPLGIGSAQISVIGTERRNLGTYQFRGVKLADITELKYSTYNASSTNGGSVNRAAYINLNVDFNETDTWQGRLIFVPAENGSVIQDSWQEWDALQEGTASWGYTGTTWPIGTTPGCAGLAGTSGPRKTWNEIVACYPDIATRTTDSFVGLRVGEPYSDGYTENIDKFVIGIINGNNTHTETFDFEPTTAPAPDTEDGDEDEGSSISGGTTTFSTFSSGPTKQVLGVSTDSDTYAMLQEIKNRLGKMLVDQYVAPANYTPSSGVPGEVLGVSTSIAQADPADEGEEQIEEETETALPDEDEEAAASATPWWSQFLWVFIALWILATIGGYWRQSLTQDSMLLMAVQAAFGAAALLLLAGYLFFGLVGALWPALVVIVGSVIVFYLTK